MAFLYVELQDNEIYRNNTEDFKSSWNAGGVKVSNPQTVTFDGNTVYKNQGNGLWLDVPTDNQLLVVKNNRVYQNAGDGIRSEVANDAQIFSNVIWENGFGAPGTRDAGIMLNASSRNHAYNNVVAWNENGILVRNPQRTEVNPNETAYDYVSEVEVDNNFIFQPALGSENHFALAWVQDWDGGNIYDPAANNRGHDNRYWYPAPEGSDARYMWDVDFASLSAFNNNPGEEGGRYLSDAEKDDVTASYDIPTSPPDTTAPTTAATPSPAPNANGWNNGDVTVALSATDETGGSSVEQITYSATGAQQINATTVAGDSVRIPVTMEGETTIAFRATDNSSNVGTEKTFTVKLDKSVPKVECASADGLWHEDDVSISCTATDPISGLADETNDAAFTLSTTVASGTETANAETGSRQVTDKAGNTTTAGPIGANKIDKKVPGITIGAPPEGVEYTIRQAVAASYSCSDGGSGVASCSGPVASGDNIDSATVGGKSFTVTATDNAGNTNSATHTYTVLDDGSSAGCTITGSANGDTLTGTPAEDIICGRGGNDTIKGMSGNDTIRGDGGADKLTGGGGHDTLYGGLGKDSVVGSSGEDDLFGEDGNDSLNSKDGVSANDSLDGGPDTDTCTSDATEGSIENCER